MTSTPVLRLRTPGEIAAVVPFLTGFVPHESLVAISLRGRRRRVGLTLRADLVDGPGIVDQAVDALVRDGAGSCVLVVHTEQPTQGRHPWSGLVDDVEAGLARHGTQVQEALLVRGGRWWSYRCEGSCCPPSGTPVEVASPVVQATASLQAYEGVAVLASREELVASLEPRLPLGPALVQRLQDQALGELGRRLVAGADEVAPDEVDRWRRAVDVWEQRPGPPPPADAAALAVGLHLVQVRDTVASWGVERYDALLGLLGELCRATVAPDDAPLCAVLAWVAYARGNGALALVAVQRALRTDPTYPLARLLLSAIDALVPPEQVRDLLRGAA